MIYDTIAAIITPFGTGAVGIIRVSGSQAVSEIQKIFKGKDLTKISSHNVVHGFILTDDNVVLDEVLISFFKRPNSFTGEDIIEVCTHGGILIIQKVLERILELNIRLALPGEFSQRAYLNRKIDLVQAESIMDLIYAKSENALKIANLGMQKKISKLVINLREKILNLIAQVEVNIDYPEYEDVVVMTKEKILPQTKKIIEEIKVILKFSHKTLHLKEGVTVLIIGQPNVGKSSLLNVLSDKQRSIVSDIPGTTRDFIDISFNFQGIIINLIDTAGVRFTTNKIEKQGIKKTKELLKSAELVLLVFEPNSFFNTEDKDLLSLTKDYSRILVLNKSDLNSHINTTCLEEEIIHISCTQKKGLDLLKHKILNILKLDVIQDKDFNFFSNIRHIQQTKIALNCLEETVKSINNGIPIDICIDDLKSAYESLGLILGENSTDDLINKLFSQFCLGK